MSICNYHKKVSFDKPTLKRLKRAYLNCTGESFEFEGNQYLKAYAKYLLQYLESSLGK